MLKNTTTSSSNSFPSKVPVTVISVSPASSLIVSGLTSSEICLLVVSSSVIRIPAVCESSATVALTVNVRGSFRWLSFSTSTIIVVVPFVSPRKMKRGSTESTSQCVSRTPLSAPLKASVRSSGLTSLTPGSKLKCTLSSFDTGFRKETSSVTSLNPASSRIAKGVAFSPTTSLAGSSVRWINARLTISVRLSSPVSVGGILIVTPIRPSPLLRGVMVIVVLPDTLFPRIVIEPISAL